MAGHNANTDLFDAYFRRADLDGDGKISGAEAVAFFQGSNLTQQVLAQVWKHADQKDAGFLGRQEFYNALKLVTVAQSNRELTPEMVKAALYGPASAKIPAPRINFAATPTPRVPAQVPQMGSMTPSPSSNVSISGSPVPGSVSTNQQFFASHQNQFVRSPQALSPATASHPLLPSQIMPRSGANLVGPNPPAANVSTNWLGGGTGSPTSQVTSKGINSLTAQDGFGLTTGSSVQSRTQMTTLPTTSIEPKPQDLTTTSNHVAAKESNAVVVSGKGVASDSLFGDVFSATPGQPIQNSSAATSSAGGLPVSSAIVPASMGSLSSVKSNTFESLQSSFSQQPLGGQLQHGQSTGKQNQQVVASTTASTPTSFSAGAQNLTAHQSQPPWPRMNQSDVQKYAKVFFQVETDRNAKITGERARSLFLSWGLRREVLKQVWDLSDQDNDGMLSLKEFFVALYLMERFREGRPLPLVLPGTIMPDEALLAAAGQPTTSYGTASWGPSTGLPQSQITRHARPPVPPVTGGKPPRPSTVSQNDGTTQPRQLKPKVPVLEKHIVDQLSQEEQDSLNSKFQEASAADKKVEELEKEILDSNQKIEFFRVKMQELILYKSRCDNRLNEITERVSADKREVDLLARKYEEKYRQAGNVASKLSLEEATFRDIQERKMELYRAIVKLEAGGTEDDVLKDRADHIQSSLEELVKTMNERCKQYGLRAKPISVVELPFGWQPGIQEAAADWDENWDKFEDEGFTFVKELTLEVQNIILPPKPKSTSYREEVTSTNEGSNNSSNALSKSEKLLSTGEQISEESANNQTENGVSKRHPESPDGETATDSQSLHIDSQPKGSAGADGFPHFRDTESNHGSAEPELSRDKSFDEPNWGKFDTHDDAESVWGFDSMSIKDMENERRHQNSMFGLDDFSLKPIKTEPSDNMSRGKSSFLFADSVPSTPAKPSYIFADSVPSTPAPVRGSSIFADSVPSTPAYHFENTPGKFGEGPDEHPFNNFSRFNSFNMNENTHSPRNSFARFDSMRSTGDSDFGHGFPSSFDSFNARDSEFGHGFSSRFDSFSTGDHDDSDRFPSRFDSFNARESQDPGFVTRFDSFSTRESRAGHGFPSTFDDGGFSQSSRTLARFDSVRSSSSDFPSFDNTDTFDSRGPFKTSGQSETPRTYFDNWNETPRKDSDKWSAF
ncbi:actin cytoskeleton-regulatory complex protein PAN1 [Tripterygium wilfordii]|uniref:Actin cytoskeleton-regulatory complex protein PAN1 n=1 Tax=Tripterygium wilfordii TaxID=458696 RepID=A0A7J7CW11_TRIWF|nr:epidermal growth factor receptor substrate 15-like 1 [Tripterygium wilfordii]KAF5738086.1 actin cytoskeleton-regulatory complex protein PAN1 [Tripterygium wilfordii]